MTKRRKKNRPLEQNLKERSLKRRTMRNALLIGLLMILDAPAFALDAMPVPQTPSEQWYRVEIAGSHVGSLWTSLERIESEAVAQMELVMELSRIGQPITVRQTRVARFDAEPPFAPRSFSLSTHELGGVKRVEGRKDGPVLRIATRLGGNVSLKEVGLPRGALFEEALPFYMSDRAFKIGDEEAVTIFNYELTAPIIYRIFAKPAKNADLFTAVYLFEEPLDISVAVQINKDGNMVETDIMMGGIPMRFVSASKKEATETPEGRFDIVVSTAVPFQGDPPSDMDRFLAEARLEGLPFAKAAPNTKRQTIGAANRSGWSAVEVRRDVAPTAAPPFPMRDPELHPYLSSTLLVEAKNSDIQALAKELTDGADGAWEAAERINQWVHEYVSEKRFDRGLASASETLQSRAGDCTEHTMLAVALTRAAGIPARISAGMVWLNGGFYYHFWHEAYVGEWIALDATLGQAPADARRIQLNEPALESDSALELSFNILKTMNRLELRGRGR